jgi:Cytochrome P460
MDIKGLRPLVVGLTALAVAACGGSEADQGDADTSDVAVMASAPDTTGAAIWAHLQSADYQNWRKWPGKGELYAGTQPHGMLLTTYLNDVAYEALSNNAGIMPAGAIVVKENYMPDSTLAAVTTMFKVAGYNADHNDWFFTKHLASGELDQMPNGMQMEGRLPGCQSCHMAKADNDYLYTSSMTEE